MDWTLVTHQKTTKISESNSLEHYHSGTNNKTYVNKYLSRISKPLNICKAFTNKDDFANFQEVSLDRNSLSVKLLLDSSFT